MDIHITFFYHVVLLYCEAKLLLILVAIHSDACCMLFPLIHSHSLLDLDHVFDTYHPSILRSIHQKDHRSFHVWRMTVTMELIITLVLFFFHILFVNILVKPATIQSEAGRISRVFRDTTTLKLILKFKPLNLSR